MIRFSTSGCAIVDVDGYMSEQDMFDCIDMFKDNREQKKNVEFVIRTGYPIIDASEDSFQYNGGKARSFEIKDLRWRHLKRIGKLAFVTIQQGSWYFTFSAKEGVGFWYSGDMLNVGWWHGEEVQAIDHDKYTMTRRDYGA